MIMWLSLAEAAELEGVTYQAIQQKMTSGMITKQEPNPNGGKPQVFIAIESLSEEAQERFWRREREKRYKQEAELMHKNHVEPWYYEVDVGWYLQRYHDEYMKAASFAQEIEKYYLEKPLHYKQTTEFTRSFVADRLRITDRQFRRYLKRYNEAQKWADTKSVDTGQNFEYFKVLALCEPPRIGMGEKLTPEMKALIENIWSSEKFQKNNCSIQLLYNQFRDLMQKRGAEYIPGYNTVKRYTDEINSRNYNVKTYLKHGIDGFRNRVMMKRERDIKSLSVMQCVQGDAHTLDCWCSYTMDNGRVTAVRPYLVAFIDMRSRALWSWCLCIQPNAEVIKRALISGMYNKNSSPVYGVPECIYIDNGKDFTAETLTGRKRTERFDVDDSIKGFYKSIGVQADKRALPYTPWTKAQMERYFGTLIEGFTKTMDSYTGTLTGSRTDAKVKRDIKNMLEHGELISFDELYCRLEEYINAYHNKPHRGLKEQGEPTPTPFAVWENAQRYKKAAPPIEYTYTLLGRSEERIVYNIGVKLNNRTYMSEELAKYIGERVIIRYQEQDMSKVICCTFDGKFICTAHTYEKLKPLAEYDDEILNEHIKSQRRQYRAVKEEIEKMQTPYEMRGVKAPELSGIPQKVTAMPSETDWEKKAAALQGDTKAKKKSAESPRKMNEFMKKQAEKAFERIG